MGDIDRVSSILGFVQNGIRGDRGRVVPREEREKAKDKEEKEEEQGDIVELHVDGVDAEEGEDDPGILTRLEDEKPPGSLDISA